MPGALTTNTGTLVPPGRISQWCSMSVSLVEVDPNLGSAPDLSIAPTLYSANLKKVSHSCTLHDSPLLLYARPLPSFRLG